MQTVPRLAVVVTVLIGFIFSTLNIIWLLDAFFAGKGMPLELLFHVWVIPVTIFVWMFTWEDDLFDEDGWSTWLYVCFIFGALCSVFPLRYAMIDTEISWGLWLAHWWGLAHLFCWYTVLMSERQ